jgi:ketopantoate hydroxymethyltransferase
MAEGGSIGDGLRRYVQAVKQRSFPDTTLHTY